MGIHKLVLKHYIHKHSSEVIGKFPQFRYNTFTKVK